MINTLGLFCHLIVLEAQFFSRYSTIIETFTKILKKKKKEALPCEESCSFSQISEAALGTTNSRQTTMLHFFEHCCRLGEVVLLGRYSEQKPNFTSNCSLPRSSHTLQLYRVSTHSSDCIFTKHRTCILQIQKYLRLFCFVVNRCGESLWRKTPSHMHSLKA